MNGFSANSITKSARQFLSQRYNKITNLSMGLIAYLYIKQTKKDLDEIFLIGFTHLMNKDKHNPDGEKDFFDQEIKDNICQIISLM